MLAGRRITVEGHADGVGSRRYNQTLSEARARAVIAVLEAGGVAGDRLHSRAYGKDRPLEPNRLAERRGQSRRPRPQPPGRARHREPVDRELPPRPNSQLPTVRPGWELEESGVGSWRAPTTSASAGTSRSASGSRADRRAPDPARRSSEPRRLPCAARRIAGKSSVPEPTSLKVGLGHLRLVELGCRRRRDPSGARASRAGRAA